MTGTVVDVEPGRRERSVTPSVWHERREALDALRAEQARAARWTVAGPAELERWVEQPLHALEPLLLDGRAVLGVQAIRRRLYRELAGVEVMVAPLRVRRPVARATAGAAGDRVAVDAGPVEIDRVLRLLAPDDQPARRPGDLTGPAVECLLNGWSDDDQRLAGDGWSPNPLRPSTAVLLAWLHQTHQELRAVGDTARAARAARRAEHLLALFAPGGLLVEPPSAPPTEARFVAPGAAPTDAPAVAGGPASAARRAAEAVAEARRRTSTRRLERRHARTALALTALGAALWLGGTWGADPAAMTDLGLLSIIRPPAFLGAGALVTAFVVELRRTRPAVWRLALPVLGLVTALQATPSVLYGTLRYSWAWKHLGILDYIHRHGAVDPSIGTLGVYHNWPGFFAGTSALTDLLGLPDGISLARWWPLAADLAVIPVLLYLYTAIWGGQHRRERWLAVLLFSVANWVGQDYFSPQSLCFLLYLVVIAVLLHHYRVAPASAADARRSVGRRSRTWWPAVVVLAASAVIVTSHQITPFMLVVALVGLTAARQVRGGWLTVAVLAMTTVWSVTGAWNFMRGNIVSLLSTVGQPVGNTDQNLVDQGRLTGGQVLVSNMGRVTVVAIAVVAAFGVLGLLRRRSTDSTGLILLVTPAALIFANSFDGEIAFRTYLFALPMLSWYAARAIWLVGSGARRPVGRSALLRAGASALVALVLLSGYCFGYYGKDQWYFFSHDEVAASDLILSTAPKDSLLVTVTSNYPDQWKNYERLVYVPIASEPSDSKARVLADPATVLAGWLADPRYRTGYILLTRSQQREVDALGELPAGDYARLERSLATSPRFRAVYRSPDAQVYVLAGR